MENNIYTSRASSDIKATFFGKVMAFFAVAIFANVVGVYLTMTYALSYFTTYPWLMYVVFGAELILVFSSRVWSKKVPLNRVLFALFALLTGVTIAPLIGILAASPGGLAILVKALLATGFMFTATALIGWTTKWDLSGMRGFLLMGLIGMIIVGIVGIFIPWGNTMEMVYSGIGVLLFSAFTMYDFQKLKHYPEDRYIDAALSIYLDIFNLFLFILRLLISLNRR
ncbi:hypothetical protein GF354_01725 [Candidatus Peregrinibacteria bacterium]|nr:hypothetical protein [Candidatus Peregrinibacteria bacterium]